MDISCFVLNNVMFRARSVLLQAGLWSRSHKEAEVFG